MTDVNVVKSTNTEGVQGVGEMETGDTLAIAHGGTGASDAATARNKLGAQTAAQVLTDTTAAFTAPLLTKLEAIEAEANKYQHPNHTGDVTSTGDGVTLIANKQTLAGSGGITITNAPTVIGALAPVISATFGTMANTFCQGNDPRLSNARIPTAHGHDGSEITSGTIDLARLPAAALERLVHVADQTARYTLTTGDIQKGDHVKQNDTGALYFVVDELNLDNAAGYEGYTALSAASVPWSGVTGKPSTFPPSPHSNHTASDITDFDVKVANNSTVAANTAKLSSVADGATANLADATLLNRANHTGTESVSGGGTGLTTIPNASVLVTNSANVLSALTAGALQSIRRNAGNTAWEVFTPGEGGGSGTVTTVSVVSANGLGGTVANPTTAPAITLTTSVNGILKGDGEAVSASSMVESSGLDSNVKLMIFAEGSGSTFVDSSASGHAVTAYGGATQSTTHYKFGDKSGAFLVSGDYISVAAHTDFDISTTNFTYDFQFRATDISVTNGMLCGHDTAWWGIAIVLVSGNINLKIADSIGGNVYQVDQTGTASISQDTWHHIALIRNGTDVKLFVDGALDISATLTSEISWNKPFGIGRGTSASSPKAYIDEFRFSRVARWTEPFTSPTASYAYTNVSGVLFDGRDVARDGSKLDLLGITSPQLDGDEELMIFFEGNGETFIDSSQAKRTLATPGSGTLNQQTAIVKHGTKSGDFTQGDAYISTPDTGLLTWTDQTFSIGFWIRPNFINSHTYPFMNSTSWKGLVGVLTNVDNFFSIRVANAAANDFQIQESDGPNLGKGSIALTPNEWTHIGIVRVGTSIKTYINGNLDVDATLTENIGTGGVDFKIGGNGSLGYMDDFIVSPRALWTGPFTPPGPINTPTVNSLVVGGHDVGSTLQQLLADVAALQALHP